MSAVWLLWAIVFLPAEEEVDRQFRKLQASPQLESLASHDNNITVIAEDVIKVEPLLTQVSGQQHCKQAASSLQVRNDAFMTLTPVIMFCSTKAVRSCPAPQDSQDVVIPVIPVFPSWLVQCQSC